MRLTGLGRHFSSMIMLFVTTASIRARPRQMRDLLAFVTTANIRARPRQMRDLLALAYTRCVEVIKNIFEKRKRKSTTRKASKTTLVAQGPGEFSVFFLIVDDTTLIKRITGYPRPE